MKPQFLAAICVFSLLASCAAPTTSVPPVVPPALVANATPMPVAVALAEGLIVTPVDADAEDETEMPGDGAWKFRIATAKPGQRVICAVELREPDNLPQTLAWVNYRLSSGQGEAVIAASWPHPAQGAPHKIQIDASLSDTHGGTSAHETANDSFASSALMRPIVADPLEDGSFLLSRGIGNGYQSNEHLDKASRVVCRFRIDNSPPGQVAGPPPPTPFELRVDRVEFEPAYGDLLRNGYAYSVKTYIGYRGPRPDWWGQGKWEKWIFDTGLVYPQGQNYRRLNLSNGTQMLGGTFQPHFGSDDKYVGDSIIAFSDLKNRWGKVAFKGEWTLTKGSSKANSRDAFRAEVDRKQRAVIGTAKAWVVVPSLKK